MRVAVTEILWKKIRRHLNVFQAGNEYVFQGFIPVAPMEGVTVEASWKEAAQDPQIGEEREPLFPLPPSARQLQMPQQGR